MPPTQSSNHSEVSEGAVQAVARYAAMPRSSDWGEGLNVPRVRALVAAAHDPALGLDRSVCLRDVVEAIQAVRGVDYATAALVAAAIKREFGGSDV